MSAKLGLEIYKCLLHCFSGYADDVPASGVDSYLEKAIDRGKAVIPSDSNAQDILYLLLCSDHSDARKVHELLNFRFDDLCVDVRPLYLDEGDPACALWKRGDDVFDRVLSLLAFDGPDGKWADPDGDAVKIITPAYKE